MTFGKRSAGVTIVLWILLAGCAHVGRLSIVPQTLAPIDTTVAEGNREERGVVRAAALSPLFGPDTLIGFQPATGDSSRRFLGRLRDGYTADTLNIFLLGDNRPGFRAERLNSEMAVISQGLSLNPLKIGRALVTIPYAFLKGMIPDLGLIRDIPVRFTGRPTYGREHTVLAAILSKVDSLRAQGRTATAVINSGDLVYRGSNPAHWARFLRITQPLSSRVPYFAVAGNHEQTWTEEGIANWHTATGLPISGDRMYYCFDSADGWVRFIALDTNPITMPGVHWSADVQVKYSKEEVDWLSARLKEHTGPSVVFMHSPPFSSGIHRMEWEMDPIMRSRRDQIVQAMHEGGLSVMVSGHEHDYQRALVTFPDGSVLISIVTGGAGAPLYPLPAPAAAAQVFATYKPAGGVIKPENVYTAEINSFTYLRLWFGGGELQTYAVYKNGSTTLVDEVKIDLQRYGTPKIDQHKVPIAPTSRVQPSSMEAKAKEGVTPAKTDTTTASNRLQTQPAPGKKNLKRPAAESPVPH